jgi:threonine dehydrogenase-like Zn-dependent dehydrogenase
MAADKFGFDNGHTSVDAAIKATDGEGYDVLFDATGHGGAIEAGFPAVAHGGSYVLVSVVKDDITFNDPEFHKREMRLIGSRNALKADFDWVMSAFRDNLIDADALCSSVISLDDLTITFGELAADRAGLIKAIVQLND